MLEDRIKGLHKELIFLKDIFLAHATHNHKLELDPEIRELLDENND